MPRTWSPVLDGAQAAGARVAIESVLEAIEGLDLTTGTNASLASGSAGMAILFDYAARAHPAPGREETGQRMLDHAIDVMAETTMTSGLYDGFPGVAWAAEHLHGDDDDDSDDTVEEALLADLDCTPWTGEIDLVSGLVGAGVYALERLPRPLARTCLERVVDRLDETATRSDSGTTWWIRPHLLSEEDLVDFPEGYCDLGLAHGVPGVIALLGEAYAAGVARSRCAELLEGGVRWLLAQALAGDAGFPAFAPLPQPIPTRTAWCRGDPGVAVALMIAARRAGEPRWEAEALIIAHRARLRPFERTGILDAGLCHGTAGLAHIFTRIFHATGDEAFRDAAREAFARTLALRTPEGGVGGFRTWAGEAEDGGPLWEDDASLLGGAAGIALSLLAATSSIEPTWDRMLLLRP